MAERKRNETIEQQRKARQEFLELKKMQQGEMETGPKPSEVAIVPKTPMEKLKNIWFHDKWYIIGVLALIIVIAIMVTQCATKEKYDLEVVIYTYQPIMDDSIGYIETYLEQYCPDIDGDGNPNIQVINCSFNGQSNDMQYKYTMSSKLQAVIAADANALLFITDEDALEYLNGLSEEGSIFDGEPLMLSQDFYDKCNGDDSLMPLPEGLMISCRKVSGTLIEKDENIKAYLDASQKILNGLKDKTK